MTGEPHRALREQLGAYALGQLSGEPWRAVHAHLTACAQCRTDLEEIAPVGGLLGRVAGRVDLDRLADPTVYTGSTKAPAGMPPPLSPALLAEVRAAAEVQPAAEGRVDQLARRRSTRPRRFALIAAAAAAVLAIGGVGFVSGMATGGVTAPAGEPVAVRTVAQQVQADARLVAHTWGMEVKLTATGFAAGETYRVMVTDDAGRTVSAGEFIGTGEAEMRCNLNSSVLRANAATFQVIDTAGGLVLDASL